VGGPGGGGAANVAEEDEAVGGGAEGGEEAAEEAVVALEDEAVGEVLGVEPPAAVVWPVLRRAACRQAAPARSVRLIEALFAGSLRFHTERLH
jgi:hypothetical protein